MVEHGKYLVSLENSIISITFFGMFNAKASEKVCAEVEEIVKQMNGAQFSMLINMLEYEGSTPDAHKIGDKHFEWLETQNCIARASVVTNMVFVEISKSQQSSLRHSKIKANFFENELDAKQWLTSLIT